MRIIEENILRWFSFTLVIACCSTVNAQAMYQWPNPLLLGGNSFTPDGDEFDPPGGNGPLHSAQLELTSTTGGNGVVFKCLILWRQNAVSGAPAISSLSSPAGPIATIHQFELGQYLGHYCGFYPDIPPGTLPDPEVGFPVHKVISSGYIIQARADVEITFSTQGGPVTTVVPLSGQASVTINQCDKIRNYDWD